MAKLDDPLVKARWEEAVALAETGRLAEAAIAYQDILEMDPDNAAAMLGLAEVLMDLESATSDREGSEDDSISFDGEMFERVETLMEQGRLREADAYLQSLLRQDPSNAWAMASRASVLLYLAEERKTPPPPTPKTVERETALAG